MIAGKGHEQGQEIGGEKLPFDDREVAPRGAARDDPALRRGARARSALGELARAPASVTGLEIDSRLVSARRPLRRRSAAAASSSSRAADRGAATLVPHDEYAAMAIDRPAASRPAAPPASSASRARPARRRRRTSSRRSARPVARTVATEGSYNAELGVPLTLGRLEPDTEICIVEMGMRGFGQIAELCEIARPDVGVITAIGPVHLELVGSVDGVARSKAELRGGAAGGRHRGRAATSAELEPYLRDDLDVRRVGAGRRRAARGRRARRLRRRAASASRSRRATRRRTRSPR